MTDRKRDYVVQSTGWVAGRRRAAGDIVALTPAAARYEPLLEPKPATRPARRKAPSASDVEDAAT